MKKNIGTVIKKFRTDKGIKQIFVAKKVGISNRYLSGIETGHRNPSFKIIEKITIVLNISLSDLFTEYENISWK